MGAKNRACPSCGKGITAENGIRVRITPQSPDGYATECALCAGKRFARIYSDTGVYAAAMYAMCAAYDLPYEPDAIQDGKAAATVWKRYLASVDTGLGFGSGIVLPDDAARGLVLSDGEKKLAEEKKNREAWYDRWGSGLDDSEYEELDRKYRVESHEFKGNITPRIEKNLIALSKLDLEFDRAVRRGDFDTANRITDIIKKTRDMESMKASDEKPAEEMRVDAIVDALEKRGAMTDGTLCDRKTLLKWIAESTRGNYATSLDVIDTVMLVTENARRRTEGERPLSYVPKDLQIDDARHELQDEMTPQEMAVMQELGRVPPEREKV